VLIEPVIQEIFIFEKAVKIIEQLSEYRTLNFIAQWSFTLLSTRMFRTLPLRAYFLTIIF